MHHASPFQTEVIVKRGGAVLLNDETESSPFRGLSRAPARLGRHPEAALAAVLRERHAGDLRMTGMDYQAMLRVAVEEARQGLAEGGIPIGAALFDGQGRLLGRGHNRRVQEGDPSIHGETDAFRKAGRQRSYRDTILVTTLAPCWYCSGLVRQFKIGTVVVGESVNFPGGLTWLHENGIHLVDLASRECIELLASYIRDHPDVWNEDIGESPPSAPERN
jgi:cytosine/creatinine deaminase